MIIKIKVDNPADKMTKAKQAFEHINKVSSEARAKFITDVKGQEVVYTMKRDEAARYLSDDNPDLASYPLIVSEIRHHGRRCLSSCDGVLANV